MRMRFFWQPCSGTAEIKWVMSHFRMSHVSHMDESCLSFECSCICETWLSRSLALSFCPSPSLPPSTQLLFFSLHIALPALSLSSHARQPPTPFIFSKKWLAAISCLQNTSHYTSSNCNMLYHMLYHAAAHCNMLQQAATCCNKLPHAATCCKWLQLTATHCTATHCNSLHNTSQHIATRCNML